MAGHEHQSELQTLVAHRSLGDGCVPVTLILSQQYLESVASQDMREHRHRDPVQGARHPQGPTWVREKRGARKVPLEDWRRSCI